MQVHDGLAGGGARVHDAAEAGLGDAAPLGHRADGGLHRGKRLGRHVVDEVVVMGLGDHEDVDGRLRVEVAEGDDVLVLVEELGGDLPVGDLAEDAVGHGYLLLGSYSLR